jgi:tripartite-type tricarboxylate transporter receptor subunit TctC
MLNRRRLLAATALGTALSSARAEDAYPSRFIKLVVPFSPGALTGTFAQILGEGLTERMGRPVVIDYRPGATGNIGSEYVAKSPPDGYTLLLTTSATFTINPSVYAKMLFDPIKDFDHIATGVAYGTILVVPPSSPFKSVDDIIAYGKANPGKLTHGSAGTGSSAHLAGELFASRAGFQLLHVPYKGGPPARIDLLAGRISLMFTDPSAVPLIQQGALRALAVSSAHRSPALPDVPTLAEAGLKDFSVETWFGIAAPAGTPKAILRKLNSEITTVLTRTETRQKLLLLGAEVPDTSTAALMKRLVDERAMWAPIIQKLGIAAE